MTHSTVGTQHPFLIDRDAVLCLMGFIRPLAGKGCPHCSSHPTNTPLIPAPFPGKAKPSPVGRDLEQLG